MNCNAPSYLEGLDKGPKQDSYGVALSQQFDEPRGTKEPEKSDVDEIFLQGARRIALNETE